MLPLAKDVGGVLETLVVVMEVVLEGTTTLVMEDTSVVEVVAVGMAIMVWS